MARGIILLTAVLAWAAAEDPVQVARAPALQWEAAQGSRVPLSREELEYLRRLPGYRLGPQGYFDAEGRPIPMTEVVGLLRRWHRGRVRQVRRLPDRELNWLYFERAFTLEPEEVAEVEAERGRRRARVVASASAERAPPSDQDWAASTVAIDSHRSAPSPEPRAYPARRAPVSSAPSAAPARTTFHAHASLLPPPPSRWSPPPPRPRPYWVSQAGRAVTLVLTPVWVTGPAGCTRPGWLVEEKKPDPASVPPGGGPRQVRLLYFTAKGCDACDRVKPQVEELGRRLSSHGSRFALQTHKIDEDEATAKRHNVTSVPVFLVMLGDKEEARFEGASKFPEVEPKLLALLGSGSGGGESVPPEVPGGSAEVAVLHFTGKRCSACEEIAPQVAALKQSLAPYGARVAFQTLDIAETEATAAQHGVSAAPAFVVLKGGAAVAKFVGKAEFEGLAPKLRELLGPPPESPP